MAAKTPERQIKWQAKYDAENCIHVSLKFHKEYDRDILQWLSHQKNKQGAIKEAIRVKIADDP